MSPLITRGGKAFGRTAPGRGDHRLPVHRGHPAEPERLRGVDAARRVHREGDSGSRSGHVAGPHAALRSRAQATAGARQ